MDLWTALLVWSAIDPQDKRIQVKITRPPLATLVVTGLHSYMHAKTELILSLYLESPVHDDHSINRTI